MRLNEPLQRNEQFLHDSLFPLLQRPYDGRMADLAEKLIALFSEDQRVRARLSSEGALFRGYHPEMERVHLQNAAELKAIIEANGFPDLVRAGEKGCAAACRIALHAISLPDFQRHCLRLMQEGMEAGRVPANFVAILTDRVRFFEGRLQLYGTNMDWDGNGKFVVTPVEDEGELNQRRAFMGLPPMNIRGDFESAAPEKAPDDPALRQKEFLEWARRVGWRK